MIEPHIHTFTVVRSCQAATKVEKKQSGNNWGVWTWWWRPARHKAPRGGGNFEEGKHGARQGFEATIEAAFRTLWACINRCWSRPCCCCCCCWSRCCYLCLLINEYMHPLKGIFNTPINAHFHVFFLFSLSLSLSLFLYIYFVHTLLYTVFDPFSLPPLFIYTFWIVLLKCSFLTWNSTSIFLTPGLHNRLTCTIISFPTHSLLTPLHF